MPTDPLPEPPAGWKRLRMTLARRATDLIAIGIVAAGVLAVSGRLTEWWNTDVDQFLNATRSASEVTGTQSTWGSAPALLGLGQLPVSVQRVVVRGEEAVAVKTLLEFCRRTLERSAVALAESPNAAAEQQLLRGLEALTPVEKLPRCGRIYRLDGEQSPLVGLVTVGVRQTEAGIPDAVACWGMALPRDAENWTVFLFDKTTTPSPVASDLPLPSGAQPILSLGDPSGGQLASFEQTDVRDVDQQLTNWRAFFTREFTERHWQATRAWGKAPFGWAARFERRSHDRFEAVELILTSNTDRRVHGVANWIVEAKTPAKLRP